MKLFVGLDVQVSNKLISAGQDDRNKIVDLAMNDRLALMRIPGIGRKSIAKICRWAGVCETCGQPIIGEVGHR